MATDKTDAYRKKILTIPNVLSFLRICLIPIIVWLYSVKRNYLLTMLVLLLSAATDVADGIIARKCGMVSDFGKMFDPIADKLTQIATLYCLVSRFWYMLIPLVLLVVKEMATGITSLIVIRKTGTVKGAVWHGKLTTVVLYSMMVIHLIWYNIWPLASWISVGICLGVMLLSFVLYMVQYVAAIRNRSVGSRPAGRAP